MTQIAHSISNDGQEYPKILPAIYGNNITEWIILYLDPSIGGFGNGVYGWDRCNDASKALRLWNTETYSAALYKRAGEQFILTEIR